MTNNEFCNIFEKASIILKISRHIFKFPKIGHQKKIEGIAKFEQNTSKNTLLTYHSRVGVEVAVGCRITNLRTDFPFDPVVFPLQHGRTRREYSWWRCHHCQPFVPHVRNDSVVRMHDMNLKINEKQFLAFFSLVVNYV